MLCIIMLLNYVQTLRNLVNTSGKRISELFTVLDHRLKSVDKKNHSRFKSEGKGGGRRMEKTKTTEKRPHVRKTVSTSNIVSNY